MKKALFLSCVLLQAMLMAGDPSPDGQEDEAAIRARRIKRTEERRRKEKDEEAQLEQKRKAEERYRRRGIWPAFYEHPALEKMGFFTEYFTWREEWGDPEAPFIWIDGTKHTRRSFFRTIYKELVKDYGERGCPREYWPEFVPLPEWKDMPLYPRNPKNKLTVYDRALKSWEQNHWRERTPDEIGMAQAKVVSCYMDYRLRPDLGERVLMDVVKYTLLGYPPLIYDRSILFEGAFKWAEKIMKMGLDEENHDFYLAQGILNLQSTGKLGEPPPTAAERKEYEEKEARDTAEEIKRMESRPGRLTPEEHEQWVKEQDEESERRRKKDIEYLQFQMPKDAKRIVDELSAKPTLTEQEQMMLEAYKGILETHNRMIADIQGQMAELRSNGKPTQENVDEYRRVREYLLKLGIVIEEWPEKSNLPQHGR